MFIGNLSPELFKNRGISASELPIQLPNKYVLTEDISFKVFQVPMFLSSVVDFGPPAQHLTAWEAGSPNAMS